MLQKKHDEVLLAKVSPIGKGWRTNALPFNTSLRKKKRFRKVAEARYRPEHKLFATLTDQVSHPGGTPALPSPIDQSQFEYR